MSADFDHRLTALEQSNLQTNQQINKLVGELHSLTQVLTRYITHHEHTAEQLRELKVKTDALDARVDKNDITLATHQPVIEMASNINKKVWIVIVGAILTVLFSGANLFGGVVK